jgi:signal recognition particle subunit SRP19
MPMKDGKVVIWPAYIDSTKTRSEGRIISKKNAVSNPTIDEIAAAALKMGLSAEVERDKSYPRQWWEESGRVFILKSEPKTALAKKIGRTIRQIRG